jgi:hypothetical protein
LIKKLSDDFYTPFYITKHIHIVIESVTYLELNPKHISDIYTYSYIYFYINHVHVFKLFR